MCNIHTSTSFSAFVNSFTEASKHFLVFSSIFLLPKSFRWIEFAKKSVAKRVANLLNGEQIGVFSLPFYSSLLLLVVSCMYYYV